MNKIDRKILEYLENHAKGTSGKIAEILDKNRSTISKHLQYLKREEKIVSFDERGHTAWKLKEKEEEFSDIVTFYDLTENSVQKFNIKDVEREFNTLKNPEIEGTEAEKDYFKDFRELFPPINRCELNTNENKIIVEVIEFLKIKFKEVSLRDRIVDILASISRCKKTSLHKLIRDNLIPIIKKNYKSLSVTGKKDALRLFQQLSSDKDSFIFSLINEAIINWSDEEFNQLKKVIDLSSLENKESYLEKLKILRAQYERKNEIERVDRIKYFIDRLYQMV